MLNKASGVGKGKLIVGRGKYSVLIQVFAVGRNPFTASTKKKDGWILNPRIGSLSAAAAKRRTSLRSMVPLCPPGMKFKKKNIYRYIHTQKKTNERIDLHLVMNLQTKMI